MVIVALPRGQLAIVCGPWALQRDGRRAFAHGCAKLVHVEVPLALDGGVGQVYPALAPILIPPGVVGFFDIGIYRPQGAGHARARGTERVVAIAQGGHGPCRAPCAVGLLCPCDVYCEAEACKPFLLVSLPAFARGFHGAGVTQVGQLARADGGYRVGFLFATKARGYQARGHALCTAHGDDAHGFSGVYPDFGGHARPKVHGGGCCANVQRGGFKPGGGHVQLDTASGNLGRAGAIVGVFVDPLQVVELPFLLPGLHGFPRVFGFVEFGHGAQVPEAGVVQADFQGGTVSPDQGTQRAIAQRECLVPRGRRGGEVKPVLCCLGRARFAC